VKEVYRFYTVPASNTAVGHIILENAPRRTKSRRPALGRGRAARPKRAAQKAKQVMVRSKQ
jgi:protocatechuate 4,5-dioxygenase, beta chain